jgi:hypothetical protein
MENRLKMGGKSSRELHESTLKCVRFFPPERKSTALIYMMMPAR